MVDLRLRKKPLGGLPTITTWQLDAALLCVGPPAGVPSGSRLKQPAHEVSPPGESADSGHPPKCPAPVSRPARFETKSVFAIFVTAITGSGCLNCYPCNVTSKPRGLP